MFPNAELELCKKRPILVEEVAKKVQLKITEACEEAILSHLQCKDPNKKIKIKLNNGKLQL